MQQPQSMRYLICTISDGGFITTLSADHDLERARRMADSMQSSNQSQVKVLERTRYGYRVAYVSRNK